MLLGDEHFDNVTEVMQQLTSQQFSDQIRSQIDDQRTYFDPGELTDTWLRD